MNDVMNDRIRVYRIWSERSATYGPAPRSQKGSPTGEKASGRDDPPSESSGAGDRAITCRHTEISGPVGRSTVLYPRGKFSGIMEQFFRTSSCGA